MGLWSRIKSAVSRTVSRFTGGSSSSSTSTSSSTTSSTNSTSSGTTSSSSGSRTTSSSGGGGSTTTTFTNSNGSTGTITTTEIKPTYQDPIRVIDTNQGAITIRGKNAWTTSRSSGGGGGSSTPVSVTYSGNLTQQQTQEVLASRGFSEAYIKQGSGTPTSPTVLEAAKKKLAEPVSYQKPLTQADVAPTTLWGKTWLNVKTAYVASPFGMSTTLPNKYHNLRETGASKWINTLTWSEARSGILDQKIKEARADQQIAAINKFNLAVENAPEDVKYDVYTRGRMELTSVGVFTSEKNNELSFWSPELEASTSQNVYDWRQSKGNKVAKGFLSARIVSSEALKVFGGGVIIGSGLKAAGAGRVAAAFPKASKIASTGFTLGVGGLWLGASGYKIAVTPKSDRPVALLETGGQALGFGLLYGQARSARKANEQAKIENYQKNLRYEHLKNVKNYGATSKYAKTSYKQVGLGKQLTPSVQKSLAKQFGVSQSTIQEASLYRQYLNVKSPAGFKPYQSGKWGISFAQKSGGKTLEFASTFRVYGGKPTSLDFRTTLASGKYAYTSVYSPKGKGYLQTNYLTRTIKSFTGSSGSIKTSGYITETRLVPAGSTAGSPKELWKSLTPSLTVSKTASSRIQVPKFVDVGGGLRVSKGDYLFASTGTGQPYPAIKNVKINQFVPAPKGSRSPTDYSAWTKNIGKTFGGSSTSSSAKGQVTQTVSAQNVVNVQTIAPQINTLTINARAPKLIKVRSGLSYAALFGVATSTAISNVAAVRSTSQVRAIQIPSLNVKSITGLQSLQTPTSALRSTTITTAPTIPSVPNIIGGGGGTNPTPSITLTPPPFLALPSLMGGLGGIRGVGKIGAKAKYGYTPSYDALVFGIKGKAPKTLKGRYTGLEFRPITQGWLNQFKSRVRLKV